MKTEFGFREVVVDRPGIEAAYRRGFTQGAFEAVRAVEDGFECDFLREWIDELMTKWRYTDHNGRMEPPFSPEEIENY